MMKGYFAYFAVPTNTYLLSAFRYHTSIIWFRSLRRRSQRHRLTWERMIRLIKRFLPSPLEPCALAIRMRDFGTG